MPLATITQTAGDVAKQIKRAFGDEAGIQVTDEDIYRWINMGQREILIKNPVLKASGSTDVIANQQDYDLSSLNIYRIQSLWYNGQPLPHRSFQEAEEYIVSQDPQNVVRGEPQLWYEWAGTIKLYPTPSSTLAGGLKIHYLKNPTPVAGPTDLLSLPDEYFNRVVEYVMSQAYELDEDSQNSQFKLGQMQQGLDMLSEKENRAELRTYPVITQLADYADDEGW